MKSLKAGIIGLGVGERHIAGYEADSRCRVTALCDLNREKLEQVGEHHPARRMTPDAGEILRDPDIDLVSIASFDNFHCDQILGAIAAGKHIFVEKPLCLLDEEFQAIVEALNKNPQIKISSNLILRRTPRFIALRERIRAGTLGEIYHLEGDYSYGRLHKILSGWRADIPFYSVVHGGAIHLIDLLLWLTEKQVEEVFAYGSRIATRDTRFRHDDMVVSLLRFTDGSTAKISANFACMVPHHHRLSIYGTQATFEQGHLGAAYFTSRDPATQPEILTDPYPGAAKGDMLPSFVAHILDGTPAEVSRHDVLTAMAVSLAIERSRLSGKPEKIRYA
jgi:predicted dehydrogenase